ncbi:MAG: hypothetical protein KAQ64_05295 [Candidatus Pacebacteria bacterium]|nr:hypothetical protein [Candidatus Paceibacterota bacterium]
MKNKIALFLCCCTILTAGLTIINSDVAFSEELTYEDTRISISRDNINLSTLNQIESQQKNVKDLTLRALFRDYNYCGYVTESKNIDVLINGAPITKVNGLVVQTLDYDGFCFPLAVFDKVPILEYLRDNNYEDSAEITLKGTFTLKPSPYGDKIGLITKTFEGSDTVYLK